MKAYLAAIAVLFVTVGASQAVEYSVAPGGDDGASGSASKPFRTIQKAADAMKPGDVCIIRAGTYRQTVRIRTSGVRFAAEPGEKVTISGTGAIDAKWSVHKGKIYKTSVTGPIAQLFVDGEMMVEARWPDQPLSKRWDKSTWRTTQAGSGYGRIVDPELAKTGVDWTGALAVLNVGAWQTFLRTVENHKAGGDSFQYAKDLGKRHESKQTQRKRAMKDFDRYFLYDKLEALDSPGEWFCDPKTSTLYLWPLDGRNPAGRTIEGKQRDYGFIANRKNHIQLDGLRFFATTVLLNNCNDCTIENCSLDYPTYASPPARAKSDIPKQVARTNAMFLGGLRGLAPTLISGKGNVVRNCSIAFSEAPGLILTGSANTVENCLIHDIDWRGLGNGVAGNCAGVLMPSSDRSIFRRNTLHHVGSSEGVVLPRRGPSICEYNYIHHGGLIQSDGALIQSSGIRLGGTIVRYNWVHDHLAFRWGGIGIRGDDLTRDLIVHHNAAWRCNEKAMMIKGDRNQVYNNTCVNNPTLDLVLWSAPTPRKEWASRQWAHLLAQQNANSKAFNNYAPVITGQMHHEIRRAGKITSPAGEMSHNLGADSYKLIDAKKLVFRKTPPPLVNAEAFDFRPAAGSRLIGAARRIEGITGKAPDVGAYERGAENYWIPGRQEPRASMPIPADGAKAPVKDIALMWLGGYKAVSFDVYVGTDKRAVAGAAEKSQEFKGNQTTNIHKPPSLKAGRTLYWRIDSLGPTGTMKGEVWKLIVVH
ncbi:MAG: right-handed parallel beta-helix repeat-containing protein [Phycisphaerae bacterium]|nr:right-handed parallel beta-helix repeat-containing protein [Phycisphaerae bacterium]